MDKIDYVTVKPVNGKRVRKPDGTLLDIAGERVPRSSFWLRRRADGNVTITLVKTDAKTKAVGETVASTVNSKK